MPCNVVEPGIPLTTFFFNGARPNVSVQAYKQTNKEDGSLTKYGVQTTLVLVQAMTMQP